MAAVAKYLADTSALSRLDRPAVEAALAPLIEAGQVATCGMVELEVLYSARGPDDYEHRRRQLRDGFEQLAMPDEIWQRAIEVQAELARRSAHRGAALPDLLIAATAERHSVTVLHYDHEFDLIASVTSEPVQWIVPEAPPTMHNRTGPPNTSLERSLSLRRAHKGEPWAVVTRSGTTSGLRIAPGVVSEPAPPLRTSRVARRVNAIHSLTMKPTTIELTARQWAIIDARMDNSAQSDRDSGYVEPDDDDDDDDDAIPPPDALAMAIRRAGWDQVPWVGPDSAWPPDEQVISIALHRGQWGYAVEQLKDSEAVYESIDDDETLQLVPRVRPWSSVVDLVHKQPSDHRPKRGCTRNRYWSRLPGRWGPHVSNGLRTNGQQRYTK